MLNLLRISLILCFTFVGITGCGDEEAMNTPNPYTTKKPPPPPPPPPPAPSAAKPTMFCPTSS